MFRYNDFRNRILKISIISKLGKKLELDSLNHGKYAGEITNLDNSEKCRPERVLHKDAESAIPCAPAENLLRKERASPNL